MANDDECERCGTCPLCIPSEVVMRDGWGEMLCDACFARAGEDEHERQQEESDGPPTDT